MHPDRGAAGEARGAQADSGRGRREAHSDQDQPRRAAERGAESYSGDPDAEPSVIEREVEAGMERDQAEG
jgi:hypothetical protein